MCKFALLFFIAILGALGVSQNVHALTSSVAIPCYYKHFKYLPSLLTSLTQQTCLPDEVVISLSQVEQLTNEEIDLLEVGPWPFQVKIIRRVGVFMEGSNRTTAAKHCSSDVVLCVDADDIPHPQRVEAVLQLFFTLSEAEMVLCGHAYCPGEAIVCEPAIPFFFPEEYAQIRFELGPKTWLQLEDARGLSRWATGVHNGSPSFRRSLLDTGIIWSDLKNGADLKFNTSVISQNHPTYLIKLPLLHYFNGRSSGADVGRE
jgi:glycosyltransferase involved in cell wall biosynthesis